MAHQLKFVKAIWASVTQILLATKLILVLAGYHCAGGHHLHQLDDNDQNLPIHPESHCPPTPG